jgi:hypothetical protein
VAKAAKLMLAQGFQEMDATALTGEDRVLRELASPARRLHPLRGSPKPFFAREHRAARREPLGGVWSASERVVTPPILVQRDEPKPERWRQDPWPWLESP